MIIVERAILVIVLLVAIVGVVGLVSRYDFGGGQALLTGGDVTGNVVTETAMPATTCATCAGYSPVCARINNNYKTYPNACAAQCDGAVVAADAPCLNLPKN